MVKRANAYTSPLTDTVEPPQSFDSLPISIDDVVWTTTREHKNRQKRAYFAANPEQRKKAYAAMKAWELKNPEARARISQRRREKAATIKGQKEYDHAQRNENAIKKRAKDRELEEKLAKENEGAEPLPWKPEPYKPPFVFGWEPRSVNADVDKN